MTNWGWVRRRSGMAVKEHSTGGFAKWRGWRFTLGRGWTAGQRERERDNAGQRLQVSADLRTFQPGRGARTEFTAHISAQILQGALQVLKFKAVLTPPGSVSTEMWLKWFFLLFCICSKVGGDTCCWGNVFFCGICLFGLSGEPCHYPAISSMFNMCQILWQVPKSPWAQHLKLLSFVVKRESALHSQARSVWRNR